MHNEEISNRVLIQLDKRYYEDGFASPIDTEQVVQEAGTPSDSSDLAFRNVVYPAQGSLIKGEKPSGQKHPKWISITPYGIETVEIKEKEFAKLHNDIRFKILLSYMNTVLRIRGRTESLLILTLSNPLD